jgi:cytochrome c551/c552
MDKHNPSREVTGVLKVMADLRESDCLSVKEWAAVFKGYYQWEIRLVKKIAVKESDVIKKVVSIMDKHNPSREVTGVLKVMVDLRESDCLSVEECAAVFEGYYQWEIRLVKKIAVKESDVIKKVVSIMDKHNPSREVTGVLKVMVDLRESDCLSVEECAAVFEGYYQWEIRLVKKIAVKESDVIKKVISIMDKHVPSRGEVAVLKVLTELYGSKLITKEEVKRNIHLLIYQQLDRILARIQYHKGADVVNQ